MKSDLQKYISERKMMDPLFAEGYDDGYKQFNRTDFNAPLERRGSPSIKWSKAHDNGNSDIICCGTADMDFSSAPEIRAALIRKAESGLYGYESKSDSYYDSIIAWNRKLYDWTLKKEWITNSPGIWPGIRIAIDSFSNPGDGILSHAPTFHPIDTIIEQSGRRSLKSSLIPSGGRYEIDYADLEEKLKQDVKIFVLVNPHNPTGRVFTVDELRRMGELCRKNNVLVISDEVYGPLALEGHRHTPFSSIDDFSGFSITLNAVSKPFNLQGLTYAILIIADKKIGERYNRTLSGYDMDFATNIFSMAAMEAAYTHGREWLEDLREHLKGNIEYCRTFMAEHLPGIRVYEPEGLFMIWLDCCALKLCPASLEELFLKEARIAPTFGMVFGEEYKGFVRLNLGCPFPLWKEILNRLKSGIESAGIR